MNRPTQNPDDQPKGGCFPPTEKCVICYLLISYLYVFVQIDKLGTDAFILYASTTIWVEREGCFVGKFFALRSS